jgi:hypothetical protein
MPECRKKSKSGIGIFTGFQLSQSGIGIPASESVRYCWSRISPALPSFAYNRKIEIKYIMFAIKDINVVSESVSSHELPFQK